MVHEYFVKGEHVVQIGRNPNGSEGVVIDTSGNITLYIETYYENFRAGITKYYNDLLVGKDDLLEHFANVIPGKRPPAGTQVSGREPRPSD